MSSPYYEHIFEKIRPNRRTRAHFWKEVAMRDPQFQSFYQKLPLIKQNVILEIGTKFVTKDMGLAEIYQFLTTSRDLSPSDKEQVQRAIRISLDTFTEQPTSSKSQTPSHHRGGRRRKSTTRRRKSYGKSKKRTRHL
jgi:hypothetical protein